MTPHLRCFEPDDYAAALALWKATPGIALSDGDEPEPIARFLRRNPGMSYAVIEDGRVVGTILCGHDGRRGLIYHFVVAPGHRGRGLGRELLRAGLRSLAEEGIKKCYALVLRNNEEGIAFWRRVAATERVDLVLFSVFAQSAA